MLDDIKFSKSFHFNNYSFSRYKYTDNRKGAVMHYFAYMKSGSCKICKENETLAIKEGDIFYIPKGCKYQSFWYGDERIEFISLGFLFMPNFENKNYVLQKIIPREKVTEMFEELVSHMEMSAEKVGKLYTLAGLLLPHMAHAKRGKATVLTERAKHYFFSHPRASVKEAARACSVSESMLYLAFQKESDLSINEFKTYILMEKAKELLVYTDTPIEDISERLEFSSSSYFRKIFKKHFNLSPREMRNKYII